MIKKSVISFLVFALAYAVLIAVFPNRGIGTHQWQENQIRAHQFLYEQTTDTVIVGTSLSARLLADSLPTVSFCAFSACVAEDGLGLVLTKEKAPRYVLLETNYFLRPSHGVLVKVNTQGIMPLLRKYIPMLREQNAPASLMGYCCMQGALAPKEEVDMKRLEENIANRISDDDTHLLTDIEVEERLQVLMPLVRELEKRGTKIILFEMPLNEKLKHVASNEQTRQVIARLFPRDKYVYLPNDTTRYLTNDGEHLEPDGQRRYSHYLKQQLQQIGAN